MWVFEPIFKSTIWGGDGIAKYKGVDLGLKNIGESWELSSVDGSMSVVSSGNDKGKTLVELIKKYGESLLGSRNYAVFGERFPLLIKIIDACRDLSVQVHPDDEMAQRKGAPNGKSELWFVVKADKGARLVNGFSREVSPEEYDEMVSSGEIEKVLNYIDVEAGDVYYIPAGRVHAICAGTFVVEIQQTSDETYRIYDYRRKDADGKERELHTELAKEALSFNDTETGKINFEARHNIPVNLIRNHHFGVNILVADHEVLRDYRESDTFVAIVVTEGKGSLECSGETIGVKQGMTVLIPASANGVVIRPEGRFIALETFIK